MSILCYVPLYHAILCDAKIKRLPAVSIENERKIRWFGPCFYSTDFKQTSLCPCLSRTFLVMGNFAILALLIWCNLIIHN
jgi:hypothetical protein